MGNILKEVTMKKIITISVLMISFLNISLSLTEEEEFQLYKEFKAIKNSQVKESIVEVKPTNVRQAILVEEALVEDIEEVKTNNQPKVSNTKGGIRLGFSAGLKGLTAEVLGYKTSFDYDSQYGLCLDFVFPNRNGAINVGYNYNSGSKASYYGSVGIVAIDDIHVNFEFKAERDVSFGAGLNYSNFHGGNVDIGGGLGFQCYVLITPSSALYTKIMYQVINSKDDDVVFASSGFVIQSGFSF